jgi:hypothetical protein
MPRITVHLPVALELSDEQLRDAATVNEAVGVAVKIARTPEVRALGGRLLELARRKLASDRPDPVLAEPDEPRRKPKRRAPKPV